MTKQFIYQDLAFAQYLNQVTATGSPIVLNDPDKYYFIRSIKGACTIQYVTKAGKSTMVLSGDFNFQNSYLAGGTITITGASEVSYFYVRSY